MTSVGTFVRTVCHLRGSQVYGRLWHRLYRPRPSHEPAPPVREQHGLWLAPAQRMPALIGRDTFCFLNETHALSECGWDDGRIERLWRYHLHYFDDLATAHALVRQDWYRPLIARWMAENPPFRGTGWEPYPTSRRIVNWIKWLLIKPEPVPGMLDSLALQARWLAQRLEWHLLGNHLFVNAKALVFAGAYFDGEKARRWYRRGAAILLEQLPEQILADGGHFERSPMYHALAFEDVLDLINLLEAFGGADTAPLAAMLRRVAGPMLYWLRCMSHPDGGIALFNDAAEGMAPANQELERYAARLGVVAQFPPHEGIVRLAQSGYVRAARGGAVALLDCAPVGPDYLPGHAHADTLSFELSLHGKRLIVNGGTSCYGTSAQRLRERGTAWHSTVEVAGQNSSEVWGGFRVGRRARPSPIRVNGWDVECEHDGYRYLPGAPRHRRRWSISESELIVEDTVLPDLHRAVARFHLAPGLTLEPDESARRWLVRDATDDVAEVEVEIGDARASSSQHAPRFGVLLPVHTLEIALRGGRARCRWRWV